MHLQVFWVYPLNQQLQGADHYSEPKVISTISELNESTFNRMERTALINSWLDALSMNLENMTRPFRIYSLAQSGNREPTK